MLLYSLDKFTRVCYNLFMSNPLSLLLGKTFAITGNIGNVIETMLGATVNPFGVADLGFWEVKTRIIDAKAYITLGGKKTADVNALVAQVYNKIKNVIFIEYLINNDKTFTVTRITLLYGLDKSEFAGGFGTLYKMESRSDLQRTLKISRKNFVKMYGKKSVSYIA